MIPISTTQIPPLSLKTEESAKMRMQSNHIGWIHSLADRPGAKFDIVIKDGLGRIRKRIDNFGSETVKAGQIINLETMVGEELTFEIENLKNANDIKLFVN